MNNRNIADSELIVQTVLKPLALAASGRTGADIERLIREARQTARREKRPVTYSDIETALTARQANLSPELLWRIAVHESGHALVATLCGVADVQTVSVGIGLGGFIESLPKKGMVENEAWLQMQMACLLGGRAAERLVLGDTALGSGGTSASDLAIATKLATDAETIFGLGEVHPLIYRSVADHPSMLSIDRQLAERVSKRLEAAEDMATTILSQHRKTLLVLASKLVKAKVLDGDEVRKLLYQPVAADP